jgi:hypothetical protein
MLCKSCRDRLVDELEHPWEGPFRIRPKVLDKKITF